MKLSKKRLAQLLLVSTVMVAALLSMFSYSMKQNKTRLHEVTENLDFSKSYPAIELKLLQQKTNLVALYEARLAANSDDPETFRNLALALLSRAELTADAADYDRAFQLLGKAEQIDPGSMRLLESRATLLLSRHRFGAARKLAEQGLQRAPDDGVLLGLAGDGALETGDMAGAEAHYKNLLVAEPKRMSSWSRMSHLAEVRGNFDEAATLMKTALHASDPKPLSDQAAAWAHSILGEIEGKHDHLDLARKHYEWALHKSPDYPLALQFLAELDQWEGKLSDAEVTYRKLLTIQADPKIKLSLAELLEQRGPNAEATRLRAEARKFYEWAVVKGNEGYLRPLATLEFTAGHYQRAATLAAQDLELRPTLESRAVYRNIVKAAEQAGVTLPPQRVAMQ